MIEFQELKLDDQKVISDFFHQGQYQNSECTFTNLYIWRKCYKVQWEIINDFLVIKPTLGEETWVLPPYGDYQNADFEKIIEQLAAYFAEIGKPFVMKAITEQQERILQERLPGRFNLREDRDLEDYLYSGDDLRELKGRKYHSKRNHLSNFWRNQPEALYETMTAEMIPEVIQFLEWWCKQKECREGRLDEGLVCERRAIEEALAVFGQLPYKAAVMRINGRVEAFTIGEWVNDQTVVIHVEKANSAINGLYGAINKEFLLHEFPEAKFVNREEDTGDEGLRKAKLSYYPLEMVKKWEGVYQYDQSAAGQS